MILHSPDGIPIAYETHGSGRPALVFVHGWSCDRTHWNAQLETFSQQYQVLALDLAGHGESGHGRKEWTIAAFGGDVAAVVLALDLAKVVLIGHSMGGDVILEAARGLKGRVAGLVWVDTYSELGTPHPEEQLEGMLAPFHADFRAATEQFVRPMFGRECDPVLRERVTAGMAGAPPVSAIPALLAAKRFKREVPAALAELGLPVIAINAADPPTDLASLRQHGVEVELLGGAGHFPMLEDPPAFNAVLAGVLAQMG